MRLLVLGGTSFVGRHIVLAARAAGLDVTLFNRGRTNLGLFSDLERITGDRAQDLSALEGRRWDAVVDAALIVRPGLVVGPHDPTDRFVRWIRRTADGGEVLAPGDPDLPLWLPAGDDAMLHADNRRARAAGLTFRSLRDTVQATLRWDSARAERAVAGLPVAAERQVLAAWHDHR